MSNKVESGLKQLMNVRLEKVAALKEKGIDPFGERYEITHHIKELLDNQEKFIQSGEDIKIAGRLLAKRGQGKAGFANITDLSGNIQIYSKIDVAGEDSHWLFKKADIGDICGIR